MDTELRAPGCETPGGSGWVSILPRASLQGSGGSASPQALCSGDAGATLLRAAPGGSQRSPGGAVMPSDLKYLSPAEQGWGGLCSTLNPESAGRGQRETSGWTDRHTDRQRPPRSSAHLPPHPARPLPGCVCVPPGPPRSKCPLAIRCSLGTSTAVSQDRDCRSPGSSSSWLAARSLQGCERHLEGAHPVGNPCPLGHSSGVCPASASPAQTSTDTPTVPAPTL